MAQGKGRERREYDRTATDLHVRYECEAVEGELPEKKVYEGTVRNIGAGGVLLQGPIPGEVSLRQVLEEKIVIRVTLQLPNETEPIDATARIGWLEPDKDNPGNCLLGLEFKEMSTEDIDKIFSLIVRNLF